MCIVLFSWQPDSDQPLVMAANRDEFHHRAAEPARWRGDLLCGLDLVANGTWLGVTREGRFAAVTNYREPLLDRIPGERSRGMLPLDYLNSDVPAAHYCNQLQASQHQFGPFNLLVGDRQSLRYMSNRGARPQTVTPGVHALSNGLLDTPWPKTRRGIQRLSDLKAGGHVDANGTMDALLTLMHDPHRPEDDELPDTGVGLVMERLVAPIFIQSPTYGTRATSALILGRTSGHFAEQRWQASGDRDGPADKFEF